MKKLLPLLTALLLLSGCQTGQPDEPAETLPEDTTAAPTETAAPTVQTATVSFSEPEPPATEPETLAPPEQYRTYLETLLDEGGAAETDVFAVLDIDGDGRDELIVVCTADETVTEYVYDGSTEVLHCAPGAVFYEGGAVSVPIPQDEENEGSTGGFVPYMLYQYEEESDGYYGVAYVNALSLAVLEEKGLADEYPEEADTSGSGTVYLIGNGDPVDVTEYELWRSSWGDEERMIEIPFVPLTQENVAAIG